ncbi:hypothetical protein MKX03_036004 [Papaver bracteatum]|nr:hypothetical protein MKX03_036004 [Papaver bracteatum]
MEEIGLGDRKFFGGETIGLTDICFGWMAHWLGIIEAAAGTEMMDANSLPRLHQWMENFKDAPVIKENLPGHDEALDYFKRQRDKYTSGK